MQTKPRSALNWFEIPVGDLNAAPSLDAVLARVAAAGGRIVTPKVQLPGDMGCFAHIADTEGNHVGLHALA